MNWLPAPRSRRWLLWFFIFTVLLWALLAAQRLIVSPPPYTGDGVPPAVRVGVIAAVLSAVINSMGWLGARWFWLLSSLGLAAGIGSMFGYGYRNMSGWEDLASFLAFVVMTAGGLALGLIAEGIRLLAIWLKRRKEL